ncbi:uridylate kinase [Methanoculleus sp. FWC-SCC3]|uniref:Uridylate kinase n=1 Tax=Methanoculleus methanifontis TaxID=2584086 RepID=A0ABT8M501_9EURY|nr:uridylate kinase [Methanoculleus sp. FWC-SCC3]MDN7013678.1 uridylate kinase [Methanoculleus sp. FWC-SCC3]
MTPLESPLVVKVGGSLFDRVVPLLDLFREAGRPVLIVPGGGKFADLVRRLDVSEDAAHWMAIAGMEQFAWYIASHGIPATSTLALPVEVTVLLPYCALRRADPLPHSWDVTSDTIAAWVARELSADLLLLKSADGIHRHRKFLARVEDPTLTSDEVDPTFIRFVFDHNLRARVVNGRHDDRVRRALRDEPVVGTLVDPRF